jgi:hypothetical protein
MATLNVSAVPSNTTVTVQDGNNITANIQGGNEINVTVVPTPRQVVQINRGVQGASGNNDIGGYPISLSGVPQNFDALMFNTGAWTNIPQTEIADGGNF